MTRTSFLFVFERFRPSISSFQDSTPKLWCIAISPNWEYQLETVLYAAPVDSTTSINAAASITERGGVKYSFAECEEKFYMPKFWKLLVTAAAAE